MTAREFTYFTKNHFDMWDDDNNTYQSNECLLQKILSSSHFSESPQLLFMPLLFLVFFSGSVSF